MISADKELKEKQKKVFAHRLQIALDKKDIKPADLSVLTGIDKGSISNYVNGRFLPKQDKLYLMSSVLSVNPSWLWAIDVLSGKEIDVLEGLHIASTPITLESVSNSQPKNIIQLQSLKVHQIPMIGTAAAGEPVYNEEADIYVDGPLKADCAIRVEGVSMEPTYLDGDLLYIRSQPTVDFDGQIAVVICGDEACVKHVYRQEDGLMLMSDNPMYAPMLKRFSDYDGNIRILGKVIGFTRIYKQ